MANRANRYITLSQAENEKLRALEQNPHLHWKVRLRVQMLRLSHEGASIQGISEYVGKSYDTVRTTFARWETEGYAGLSDHFEHQGQSPLITEAIKTFMKAKLEEERTWTCQQLAAVIKENYGVKVGSEGIRLRLKETYRNRRKRFALRFNLIAGLINAGLDL